MCRKYILDHAQPPQVGLAAVTALTAAVIVLGKAWGNISNITGQTRYAQKRELRESVRSNWNFSMLVCFLSANPCPITVVHVYLYKGGFWHDVPPVL